MKVYVMGKVQLLSMGKVRNIPESRKRTTFIMEVQYEHKQRQQRIQRKCAGSFRSSPEAMAKGS